MHARQLTELAAVVAAQGPVLVESSLPIPQTSIEEYWLGSKCRLDRWGRVLRRIGRSATPEQPAETRRDWPYIRGVIEEVLTGELLTRVWTAVLAAHDRRLGVAESEPVGRGILISHLEARHRVLSLMVSGGGIGLRWAVRLNALRRRCERWSDMLVGYLTGVDPQVAEFAVEPDRARDFAEDLGYRQQLAGGRQAWPLVIASLRGAFRQGLTLSSPNGDLNLRIAESVLACLPADLFDSTGLFRSIWVTRLTHATADAEGMIERLVAEERGHATGRGTNPTKLADRLRELG